MASPRVTDNQGKDNRRGYSRGYTPGGTGSAGTFSSGSNSFLATGSLSLALKLGLRYGVDRQFIPRYLGILTTDVAFAPLRFWQSVAYGGRIRRQELHPEPLFLLGFWRSGTTLLHNLLSMDPQWGFVSTYQAALPGSFLAGQGWVRRMIANSLPPNRGVDNIPVDLAMPQEEEIAMMCACGLSPYVFLNFPRNAGHALDYLFVDEGLDGSRRGKWRREYVKLLKAASFHMGGKPLLLKSPSNTSRVSALLEMFPAARFVYIQRNPYDTVRSYVHLLRLMNDWHALQSVDFDELVLRQIQVYRRMAEAYLEQKELIPEGRLVEISYEELEADKVGQIHNIYRALGLAGYDAFEPGLVEYAGSVDDFQKNPSHISDQVIQLVNDYVPFLVSRYGYEFMAPAAPPDGGDRDNI